MLSWRKGLLNLRRRMLTWSRGLLNLRQRRLSPTNDQLHHIPIPSSLYCYVIFIILPRAYFDYLSVLISFEVYFGEIALRVLFLPEQVGLFGLG